MMISSLMVYSGADLELGNLLGKLLKKVYRFSNYGIYAIFMGFFCGFPMGAKVVSELYEQNKISKNEANALLSFCNNIGPAYFVGIIIPILRELGYSQIFPFVFGMYGIPALYGVIIGLAYTKQSKHTGESISLQSHDTTPSYSLLSIIKKSCAENTQSIIILGGYITFTNALRIFLDFIPVTASYKSVMSSFIELTGGIQLIYQATLINSLKILWIMVSLSFGGISCFMQTSSFLEKSGLSIPYYIRHKIFTTLISCAYYLVILNLIKTKP
jgi:hypothetical protein